MTMTTLVSFTQFGRHPKKIAKQVITKEVVIYTRVSSKEQADKNLSLETQRKTIEEYALRNHMTVAAYFGGTYESAKTDGRKEFQCMLDYIRKHKGRISHILVYTIDRFSRTGGAAIKLATDLREKYGIIVFAVTQPTDTSNPSGALHQNIQLLFSEYDNQIRGQRAVAGLKEQYQKGVWASKPPQGYDTVKINGERKLVINEVGKKIRKAFLWKAAGMKNEEIIGRLRAMGVPMYKQQLTKIFTKPFYCGLINHGLLEGKIVQGNHEPLISQEIFLKVNNIHQHTAGYGVPHKKEDDHLPLKVFVKCYHCRQPFTGYLVKAKDLYYYKCRTTGCQCNKSAKKLHEQFHALLENFVVKEENIPAIQYELEYAYQEATKEQEEQRKTLNGQLMEVKKDIYTIEKKHYVKEEMSQEAFERFYQEYHELLVNIQKELAKLEGKISNPGEIIRNLLHLCTKLTSLWDSSSIGLKEELQKLIFPEGIFYDKEKEVFRTERTNVYFRAIADWERTPNGNEKGTDHLDDGLSLAADRTGPLEGFQFIQFQRLIFSVEFLVECLAKNILFFTI